MSEVALQDQASLIRNDWRIEEVDALFALPFTDLLYRAQTIHRQFFDPNRVQVSKLLSIKTGACPEDCKFCCQSAHYKTGLEREKLMNVEDVLEKAREAKEAGATRFCMGAAWRSPRDKDLESVADMVRGIKALGLEACATLGMLSESQSEVLAEAGLDFYNHNLDTSREYYKNIITTREFDDRLETLENVRKAGIHVCSGGILGMGETVKDRASMMHQLATLEEHPGNVSINLLMPMKGTPLEHVEQLGSFDFVRSVAVARILMPRAYVRLSAGRTMMNDEMHALAFMAGANSLFLGDTLLTAPLPEEHRDWKLFKELGIEAEAFEDCYSERAARSGESNDLMSSNQSASCSYAG